MKEFNGILYEDEIPNLELGKDEIIEYSIEIGADPDGDIIYIGQYTFYVNVFNNIVKFIK